MFLKTAANIFFAPLLGLSFRAMGNTYTRSRRSLLHIIWKVSKWKKKVRWWHISICWLYGLSPLSLTTTYINKNSVEQLFKCCAFSHRAMSDLKYTFSSSFMSLEEVLHNNFYFVLRLARARESQGKGKRRLNMEHKASNLLYSTFTLSLACFNATQIIFLWCHPRHLCHEISWENCFILHPTQFTEQRHKVGNSTSDSKLFSAWAIR